MVPQNLQKLWGSEVQIFLISRPYDAKKNGLHPAEDQVVATCGLGVQLWRLEQSLKDSDIEFLSRKTCMSKNGLEKQKNIDCWEVFFSWLFLCWPFRIGGHIIFSPDIDSSNEVTETDSWHLPHSWHNLAHAGIQSDMHAGLLARGWLFNLLVLW